MTKLATRRAVLAGGCKRACNQGAPTNLKSLHHKARAGAAFGAGLLFLWKHLCPKDCRYSNRRICFALLKHFRRPDCQLQEPK